MDTIMQFLQTTFAPVVLLFTVSNLGAMGLQVKMPEVIVALRNKKNPGADLRVGLGAGAGVRLSDHQGPSSGGAIRQSWCSSPVWRHAPRSSSKWW